MKTHGKIVYNDGDHENVDKSLKKKDFAPLLERTTKEFVEHGTVHNEFSLWTFGLGSK
jgi:hypothetical protein